MRFLLTKIHLYKKDFFNKNFNTLHSKLVKISSFFFINLGFLTTLLK